MPALAKTVSMPPNASTVPLDGGVERVAVGDVGLERDRAGAVGGDGLEVAEPDERDARAPRGEPARGLGADPVGGAGDEDGLAGDRGHARETNRGSSCSAHHARRPPRGRHGASSSARALGVAGARVVERGADRARRGPRRPAAGRAARASGSAAYGPGAAVVTSRQPSASASSCAIP